MDCYITVSVTIFKLSVCKNDKIFFFEQIGIVQLQASECILQVEYECTIHLQVIGGHREVPFT